MRPDKERRTFTFRTASRGRTRMSAGRFICIRDFRNNRRHETVAEEVRVG